jgi:hypothetical protein
MRQTFIAIILILIIPALCQGSIAPTPRLEFPACETSGWSVYHLEFENHWQIGTFNTGSFNLSPVAGERKTTVGSFDAIHGGVVRSARPAPRDMLSMMSFVWAEMFGGVDIVAEVKDFAQQINRKNRLARNSRSEKRDLRNKWRFIVVCRIDQQTEIAALFKNRGRFFGESNMILEINALDPISEEIGLTMAYSDGDLNVRADRITLTERAAAKLMVKF